MIILLSENDPNRKIFRKAQLKNTVELSERSDSSEKLDPLEEMSNFTKDMTGLPVNIWLDDSSAYIRGGHAKRIKFQGDYANRTNGKNLFSMIISNSDPEIPKDQISKVRLPAKDINAIKAFVKKNAELLNQLADQKVNIKYFLDNMKR